MSASDLPSPPAGSATSQEPTLSDEPRDSDHEDAALNLTPGWIAVGVAAMAVGIAMGFVMSSLWLVR